MNRTFYRIIYNAARGQLMAVAEFVVTPRRSPSDGAHCRSAVISRATVFAATIAVGALVPPELSAQIVAYRSAPGTQQPTILPAGNGVALINIQTPSAAGVSRNVYSQFDVTPAGAVLNNSRSATASQLAGMVSGNPWLASGSARVIVNEVIAAQPSSLGGYIEVAGRAAQLVIANPSGINCSGCGFINATRSTLTTGTPVFSAGGDLEGFRVERGTIRVDGAGLDASRVDYTDLIARAVSINAGIWANTLAVTAGTNVVSGDITLARPVEVPTGSPSWAIDVAALGGMYAGKITLVGSEAGVGVRNAGTIAAYAGEVVVTADGLLHNAGHLSSAGQTRIDSGGLDNAGTIYAQRDTTIATHGRADNTGTIAAQGDTTISVSGRDGLSNSTTALLAAGINAQGELTQDARLLLSADVQITLHGQAIARGEQTLRAASLDLSGARLSAGTLTLDATNGDLDMRASTLSVTGKLSARTPQALIHDRASSQAGQFELVARTFSNVQGSVVQSGDEEMRIMLTGALNNSGGQLVSTGPMLLTVGDLDNRHGSMEVGGGSALIVNADGEIDNAAGRLVADKDVALFASRIDNRQGTITSVNASLFADAGDGRIVNDAGRIEAASTIALRAVEFSNVGGVIFGRHLAIDDGSRLFDNARGTLAAREAIDLRSGAVLNDGGLIQSDGSLSIDTVDGELSNTHSGDNAGIFARDGLHIRAGELINSGGQISGQDSVAINSRSISNTQGQVVALGALELVVDQRVDNARGALAAGASLGIRANRIDNRQGDIVATRNVTWSAEGGNNADGRIVGQDLLLDNHRQPFNNAHGVLAARRSITLQSGALSNEGGLLEAGTDLTIDTHGESLTNVDSGVHGGIVARGALHLATGHLHNANGLITSQDNVRIIGKSLDNTHGQVSALAALLVGMQRGIDNGTGLLVAGTRLSVQAEGIDNRQGTLAAQHDQLSADAGGSTLDNSEGLLAADGTLHLRASGVVNELGNIASVREGLIIDVSTGGIDNNAGHIEAARSVAVSADGITNTDGTIVGQTLTIDSRHGTINNTRGTLLANGTLGVLSGTLDNSDGLIQSGGTLAIDTGEHALRNAQPGSLGGIVAQARLELTAGDLINATGRISGHDDVLVNARSVENRLGSIIALGDLLLGTRQNLDNTGGTLAAAGRTEINALAINNAQGTIAALHGTLVAEATGGAIDNSAGRIETAKSLSLSGDGIANGGGTIVGSDVTLDSHRQVFDNPGGALAALATLDVRSGALINTDGLIQSGGALAIDTHGQHLRNVNSGANRGIVAQGGLNVSAGDIDNNAGFIGARDRVSITANDVSNTADGKLSSENDIELLARRLDNRGGQIQSLGAAMLRIDEVIDNHAGVVRSARQIAIDTEQLINAGSIDGQSLSINAEQLDNRAGALRATQTLTITSSGIIDNSDGLISSSGNMRITAPATIAAGARGASAPSLRNTRGTLIADRQLVFDGASLSGDGTLVSLGNLSVSVLADFVNTGEFAANGDATLYSAGTISNSAHLRSGRTLTIDSASLDNATNGEIVATELKLSAHDAHTLTNRGLIDGGDVLIEAVTLYDVGSARLYGDHLAINASQVSNVADAGSAPVIAARNRLDIGAGNIANSEHALIFSAGDLFIGGTLDAGRHATGQADTLDNTSATIEALGDLSINANHVGNRNAHLETAVVALPAQQLVEYQGSGSPTRYTPGTPGLLVFNDESDQLMTPEGKYESWLLYDYTRSTSETQIVRSDPGKIVAAGDIQFTVNTLTNDNSQIIAGATLTGRIGSLTNSETFGERSVSDTGTVTSFWRNHRKGRDSTGSSVAAYTPPPTIQTISLGTSVFRQDAAPGTSNAHPARLDIEPIAQSAASIAPVNAGIQSGQVSAQDIRFASATLAAFASNVRIDAHTPLPSERAIGSIAVEAITDTSTPTIPTMSMPAARAPISMAATTTHVTDTGSVHPIARLVEVPLLAPPGTSLVARFVRSVVPMATLPDNSLFRTLAPDPTTRYLVQTDPQFTHARQWLSSDYLLAGLGDRSAMNRLRLGDGFYEQRLMREQVAELTGQRFLAGYADDETQYRALMDAASMQAVRLQLVPGIALSVEQMAQLTADIAWLVEQDVVLADGSTRKVLVPQVYARVRDGDLTADGALIAADTIDLELDDDLRNSATIAGRRIVTLTAENIGNIGGRIDAEDLAIAARHDLADIGGILHAETRLMASAGNDLTVSSTTRSQTNQQGGRSGIDRVAGLYVSGPNGLLVAAAGNDLALIGARIENAGNSAGAAIASFASANANTSSTALLAGHDISFSTLREDARQNIIWDSDNKRFDARRSEFGSTLRSAGDIVIQAGNDVNARAAYVVSDQGALRIRARRDINLVAGEGAVQVDEAHRHSESGFLSRTTRSTRDAIDETYTIASTLSASTATLSAGRDLRIEGGAVVAGGDTMLLAGRDIAVEAARTTNRQTHFNEVSNSGIFSSGGLGFTIGSQQQSTQQTDTGTRTQASTVGSIDGDVIIAAGNAYRQVGSDVIATNGSIGIAARSIDVLDAREGWRSVVESQARQSGLTIALSSPVITAVQSVQQMREAASATSHPRMQMLAVASSALAIKGAANAIGKGLTQDTLGARLGGIDVGLSIGSASRQSTTMQTSDSTAGSRLIAGRDLGLHASGAGETSDLTGRAAYLYAGRDLTLAADGSIALLAAANSTEQHSSSQGHGASIGFSVGTSGLLFNAGAGTLRANADGTDTTWSETQVAAGRRLTITSGNDAILRGAQAHADEIVADVGGNLNITSLPDTSTFSSEQRTGGFTLSLGAGRLSGSISATRSTISSDYASVTEQSGLQAGDAGFQVRVKGDSTLAGGVIASSQAAVDKGRNLFSTGGTLDLSDIANHSEYNAKAVGARIGNAVSFSGALPPGGLGTGAGVGEDSSNASSTTRAGISGIAGNTVVRSGDSSGEIANTFDSAKVESETNAQVSITQMFGQLASAAVADYLKEQRTQLQKNLESAAEPEKAVLHAQLNELDVKERVANVLIGAVSGRGASALTKEALSMAAQSMRDAMIENSRVFLGVTDGTTTVSNQSGVSEGVRGDQFKVGGTRMDLDLLCGTDNRRCKTRYDENGQIQLDLDDQGQVRFDPRKAGGLTLAEFLTTTDDGRKLAGITGGIQGMKGSLFGIPYEAGSWQDRLVEAFGGTHDIIGGQLSGLYDKDGNIKRGMSNLERKTYDRWAELAIVPSAPFAMSELLPPQVWQALSILTGAVK